MGRGQDIHPGGHNATHSKQGSGHSSGQNIGLGSPRVDGLRYLLCFHLKCPPKVVACSLGDQSPIRGSVVFGREI